MSDRKQVLTILCKQTKMINKHLLWFTSLTGCNVCNSQIQKLSLFCLWFSFQLRLWSMIKKFNLPKSSNESPGDTKCWLAGNSVFFVRSLLCPIVVYLLDCHVCGSQYVGESVQPFNKRMNGHRSDLTKKTLCKVTSVSIHSFVEWLDTFSYVLRSADVTVKEVNHIRCFAIDIAKYLILLSCRFALKCHLLKPFNFL
jgi:hypothetical protein